jgi:hypothetical protein
VHFILIFGDGFDAKAPPGALWAMAKPITTGELLAAVGRVATAWRP